MEQISDKRCQFLRPNNERCGAYAQTNSPFCFTHDPEKAQERAIAHRSGGLANKVKANLPPITVEKSKDVVQLITSTMNELRQGKVDIKIANALFYGSNVLLKAFEITEITERLESVERVLFLEKKNFR